MRTFQPTLGAWILGACALGAWAGVAAAADRPAPANVAARSRAYVQAAEAAPGQRPVTRPVSSSATTGSTALSLVDPGTPAAEALPASLGNAEGTVVQAPQAGAVNAAATIAAGPTYITGGTSYISGGATYVAQAGYTHAPPPTVTYVSSPPVYYSEPSYVYAPTYYRPSYGYVDVGYRYGGGYGYGGYHGGYGGHCRPAYVSRCYSPSYYAPCGGRSAFSGSFLSFGFSNIGRHSGVSVRVGTRF